MEYPVIVEHKNGIYRALIPTLADLSAEGCSADEAVRKLEQAAQNYLAEVEVRTIDLEMPGRQASRYSTAQDVLRAAGKFKGDQEAMRQHIEEIYAERQRQREEVEREIDEEERRRGSPEDNEDAA
jgi:predicted RNase H-like HicB family nuclease